MCRRPPLPQRQRPGATAHPRANKILHQPCPHPPAQLTLTLPTLPSLPSVCCHFNNLLRSTESVSPLNAFLHVDKNLDAVTGVRPPLRPCECFRHQRIHSIQWIQCQEKPFMFQGQMWPERLLPQIRNPGMLCTPNTHPGVSTIPGCPEQRLRLQDPGRGSGPDRDARFPAGDKHVLLCQTLARSLWALLPP